MTSKPILTRAEEEADAALASAHNASGRPSAYRRGREPAGAPNASGRQAATGAPESPLAFQRLAHIAERTTEEMIRTGGTARTHEALQEIVERVVLRRMSAAELVALAEALDAEVRDGGLA